MQNPSYSGIPQPPPIPGQAAADAASGPPRPIPAEPGLGQRIPSSMELDEDGGYRSASSSGLSSAAKMQLGLFATLLLVPVVAMMAGSGERELYFLSGLPNPYTIEIVAETTDDDGQTTPDASFEPIELELIAGQPVVMKLASGRYRMGTTDGTQLDASLPRTFEVSGWDRANRVINPDGAATLLQFEAPYARRWEDFDEDDVFKATFQPLAMDHRYENVENMFEPLPQEIRGSRRGKVEWQESLYNIRLSRWVWPDQFVAFLASEIDRDTAFVYARRQCWGDPHSEATRLLLTSLPADERVKILRERLDVQPVDAVWHEWYQDAVAARPIALGDASDDDNATDEADAGSSIAPLAFETIDLVDEYDARLAADPGNADLIALRARLHPDAEARLAGLTDAIAADPSCVLAHRELARLSLSLMQVPAAGRRLGDAYDAVRLREQAGDPIGPAERAMLDAIQQQVYEMSGRSDLVMKLVARQRPSEMPDLALARDAVALCQYRGAKTATGLFTRARISIYPDSVRHARREVARLSGDTETYIEALGSPHHSRSPDSRFVRLTRGQQLEAAVLLRGRQPNWIIEVTREIDQAAEATEWAIVRLTLAGESGQDRIVAHADEQLVRRLQAGSPTHRRLAELFAQDPPDWDALAALPLQVDEKRIFLTYAGQRWPSLRRQAYDLARSLNRSPSFPHRLIDSITRGRRLASTRR